MLKVNYFIKVTGGIDLPKNRGSITPLNCLRNSLQQIECRFLGADGFSFVPLLVSSKGELFDKFFVAFVFQLKPGILDLNQVVSLETSTWTQN